MQELQIFANPDFGDIRTLEENGQPLFCGNDVAKVLGYVRPNDAITAHCRYTAKHSIPHPQSPNKTIEMTFIPESDLYRLIINSKLPTAEKFESWVMEEVLPAIRKTGAYMTPETIEQVIMNPDAMITILTELKRLQGETRQQSQIIGELQPKANYVDMILDNKGTMTMTQISKDYGMSARRMNGLLYERGVQYKQSGQWFLYAKYHNEGYTHSKTIPIIRSDGAPDTVFETKWTQKGRLFIYELLKADEILPVIERGQTNNRDGVKGETYGMSHRAK